KGAGAADQKYHAEQKVAAEMSAQQGGDQNHGGQRVSTLRAAHDQAPVVAVGGVADQQRQHDRRHELNEPDQAEIERAVGQLVDLPADGHSQHLIAHGGGEPRDPEQNERSLLQQRG